MRRLLLALLVAFGAGEAPAQGPQASRETLREAGQIAMALARGDASRLEPMLDAPLLEGSVTGTSELLLQMKSKVGAVRRVRGARCLAAEESSCTIAIPIVGETRTYDLVLVLKGCGFGPGRVVGCRLQEHHRDDGAVYARDGDFTDRPPYVDESALLRRSFELDTPVGPLPAVLVLPRSASAKARVPGVLLMGHAGAQDIDGSGGNCRPLRDIADGLGASGVAVLRVAPRSALLGDAGYGAEDTFLSTDVRDARAALAMLASQPEVNRDALFAMGLGGGAATAVALASKDPSVRGLILLGPPAREDTALDLRRVAAAIAAGEIPESELRRMEEASRAVQDPRALDERRYQHRPATWWREVAALDLPEATRSFAGHVFLAMAGRDATMEPGDVERWRAAASGRERVTGRQYAPLDANFARKPIEGGGNARPAVFVAPELLRDVLMFLYDTTQPGRATTTERAPRRSGNDPAR